MSLVAFRFGRLYSVTSYRWAPGLADAPDPYSKRIILDFRPSANRRYEHLYVERSRCEGYDAKILCSFVSILIKTQDERSFRAGHRDGLQILKGQFVTKVTIQFKGLVVREHAAFNQTNSSLLTLVIRYKPSFWIRFSQADQCTDSCLLRYIY